MSRRLLWGVCLYILTLPFLDVSISLLFLGFKRPVVADVAFALLLGLALCEPSTSFSPPRRSLLVGAGLVLVAALVAGAPRGADRNEWLREAYSMSVLLLLASFKLGPADRRCIVSAWRMAFILTVALGGVIWVAQALAGHLEKNSTTLGFARLSGLMATNALAVFAAVSLPFMFTADAEESATGRWVVKSAWTCLGILLLFAPSRGTAAIALILALLSRDSAVRLLPRHRRSLTAIAFVLLTAWSAVTLSGRLPRVPSTSPNAHGFLNPQVDSYYLLHRSALSLWFKYPALGVGAGRFARALPLVISAEERSNAWPAIDGRDWDPHSLWLGWAAEGGTLGFGAWLALHLIVLLSLRGGDSLSRAMVQALIGLMLIGVHLDYSSLKFVWAALGCALAGRPRRVEVA